MECKCNRSQEKKERNGGEEDQYTADMRHIHYTRFQRLSFSFSVLSYSPL